MLLFWFINDEAAAFTGQIEGHHVHGGVKVILVVKKAPFTFGQLDGCFLIRSTYYCFKVLKLRHRNGELV